MRFPVLVTGGRLAAAFLIFALLVSGMPLAAKDFPIQGGPGGGVFRDGCPGGRWIVGFKLRSGAWVDSVTPVCADFDSRRGVFTSRAPQGTWGGQGGGPQEGYCPSDRYVSGIKFGFTRDGTRPKFVDFVELTCRPVASGPANKICLHSGEGCWSRHPTSRSVIAANQVCPAGEAATGIHGRRGAFLDALGLICGPRPKPAPIRMLGKVKSTQPVQPTQSLSADAQAILSAHNGYRNKHCVPNLTWSAQLAASAQSWANRCTRNGGGFAHSSEAWSSANGFGENLAWGTNLSARGAVDLWYREINQYNFSTPSWSSGVAHFTQVVWRNSRQLGCAKALCSGRNYWVCRYSPTGNWNANDRAVLTANVPRLCR